MLFGVLTVCELFFSDSFRSHTTDVHVQCLVDLVLHDSPFTESQAHAQSAIQPFISSW